MIIDEAHRAAAPTYRMIMARIESRKVPILGLTATPFRDTNSVDGGIAGARDLRQIFHELIEANGTLGPSPRETLQDRKVLARPVVETIQTSIRLHPPSIVDRDNLTEADIERTDEALGIQSDRPERRFAILSRILPVCRNTMNRVLYFGPRVVDAEAMAFLLRQEGIPAAVVSGSTRDATRRRAIEDFRSGAIRVLCSCEILTTGFNVPQVTHVVMARPTVSLVLYEQMVGRGLRGPRFGGTDECVIIDCDDNYKGERPPLGYEMFREVWQPRERKEKDRKAA
jgi:superfamily II DNA or RNA helicase